jgi:hypothetical protein
MLSILKSSLKARIEATTQAAISIREGLATVARDGESARDRLANKARQCWWPCRDRFDAAIDRISLADFVGLASARSGRTMGRAWGRTVAYARVPSRRTLVWTAGPALALALAVGTVQAFVGGSSSVDQGPTPAALHAITTPRLALLQDPKAPDTPQAPKGPAAAPGGEAVPPSPVPGPAADGSPPPAVDSASPPLAAPAPPVIDPYAPVLTCLLVEDPKRPGCCVEVPVCLPACCVGPPQVSTWCGLIRRRVTYCWACGCTVEVTFGLGGRCRVRYC